MKALKVTISGSYRTAKGDIIDFEDVKGSIPKVDEDLAIMHVRSRYAVMWINESKNKDGDKLYPQRVDAIRQVFVDDIKEANSNFSYIGKDIKEMSYRELQDLATAKDLRKVQLPKELSGISLREMRQAAYVAYSENVLKEEIDVNAEGFNYMKLPALVIDGGVCRDASNTFTNDEIIDQEQKNKDTGSSKENYTLKDLKKMADNKNVPYHNSIGFDALYIKLFGGSS